MILSLEIVTICENILAAGYSAQGYLLFFIQILRDIIEMTPFLATGFGFITKKMRVTVQPQIRPQLLPRQPDGPRQRPRLYPVLEILRRIIRSIVFFPHFFVKFLHHLFNYFNVSYNMKYILPMTNLCN